MLLADDRPPTAYTVKHEWIVDSFETGNFPNNYVRSGAQANILFCFL